VLRSVVDRRPLATAKSKNTCHNESRLAAGNGLGTGMGTTAIQPSVPVAAPNGVASPHLPGHHDQERANMLIRGRRRPVWAPAWTPLLHYRQRVHMFITKCRRRRPHRRPNWRAHRNHTGGHTEALRICRVPFSCCNSAGQRRVAAPAWAPRSRTCEHADKGASTAEATPRLYVAGEFGALASNTCACRSLRFHV
jgi:hypothetical protein